MHGARKFWASAALIALALLPVAVQAIALARTDVLGDFGAFYCAGRVVAQRADPYHTEPLRSCEHAVIPGFRRSENASLATVALPAPLPGYALAAFVPLSFLPFAIAAAVWLALLLLASAACVAAIARFARTPWETAIAALAFSLGVTSIPLGQTVPVGIAGICLAGYFAWRRRWRAAAVCASIATIEPQISMAACLALFVWAPKARTTLLVAGAALAGISLCALGWHTNVEYFTSVLPAHALSEAARDSQYSLTPVLVAIGLRDATAAHAGMLWYCAMALAGIAAGKKLAHDTNNAAFLVCVPPAFAVFGGSFIHLTEIAVALPVALLLLSYAGGRRYAAVAASLIVLAVPWRVVTSPAALFVPAFPVAYLAWRLSKGSVLATAAATLGAGALVAGIDLAFVHTAAHHARAVAAGSIDARFAEATWSRWSDTSWTASIASWVARIPTWVGLALLLGSLVEAARGLSDYSERARPRSLRPALRIGDRRARDVSFGNRP